MLLQHVILEIILVTQLLTADFTENSRFDDPHLPQLFLGEWNIGICYRSLDYRNLEYGRTFDAMLVGLVSLGEVFVTKHLVAEFTIGFRIESLGLTFGGHERSRLAIRWFLRS